MESLKVQRLRSVRGRAEGCKEDHVLLGDGKCLLEFVNLIRFVPRDKVNTANVMLRHTLGHHDSAPCCRLFAARPYLLTLWKPLRAVFTRAIQTLGPILLIHKRARLCFSGYGRGNKPNLLAKGIHHQLFQEHRYFSSRRWNTTPRKSSHSRKQ